MMIALNQTHTPALKPWFVPDHPGHLLGLHVIRTGLGRCWVDRFPDPRAVLVHIGVDYFLAGAPEAFGRSELRRIAGWVDVADEAILPRLRAPLIADERVAWELTTLPSCQPVAGYGVRRLRGEDVSHLGRLSVEIQWICNSWGGPSGLAASRSAWGAFDGDRLVSVACPFFVGERYEDLGVVTEPGLRGKGLSVACAAEVCRDVLRRGRRPSWLASSQNASSLKVAEKLGFTVTGRFRVYGCQLDGERPAIVTRAVRGVVRRGRALLKHVGMKAVG